MKRRTTAIFCILSMGILILDSKTALLAAMEGLELCMKTVIPSLFPFIVLSTILTSALLGTHIGFLKPIGGFLRMPEGSESIWLAGCLGGYPVGAQSIGQAVKNGMLHPEDGKRMLCFCANAGPSFLFGIGMCIFDNIWLCFALWMIHILSSVIVGILTPGKAAGAVRLTSSMPMRPYGALTKATGAMSMICGWVVLFRILLRMLQKWIFAFLPSEWQLFMSGILELSNGCIALASVENMAIRFILFSLFLAFGGLCVAMQTASVVSDIRWYLPSKVAQGACSVLLSIPAAGILFPGEMELQPVYLILCSGCLMLYPIFLRKNQIKRWLFRRKQAIIKSSYI